LGGKRAVVPDRYRETSIELSGPSAPFDRITLTARAYDDGIAFRYSIPKDAKGNAAKATRELTEYNFAGDFTAWFYNGEVHNLGPDKLSTINGNREPVMTLQAAENSFLALHEADLRQGEPLRLEKPGPTSFHALTSLGEIAPGYAGPWRAIFFGTSSSPHRKCRGAKAKRSPV
jgi:alpha-glucosidase